MVQAIPIPKAEKPTGIHAPRKAPGWRWYAQSSIRRASVFKLETTCPTSSLRIPKCASRERASNIGSGAGARNKNLKYVDIYRLAGLRCWSRNERNNFDGVTRAFACLSNEIPGCQVWEDLWFGECYNLPQFCERKVTLTKSEGGGGWPIAETF
jgi:hypothetical protein